MVLGSWEQFRERFAAPIERHRDPTRAQALSRLLRPFVLRRTKGDVAKDLPPRTEIRLDVVLSPKERAAYEDARLAAIARLADLETGLPEEQRHFHVLAALTRLRQLACHPRLADAGSRLSSSKLAALLDLVRALVDAGQRALVFSQFTQHLALVREALDKAGLPHLDLDGATPLPERARRVDRFQAGEAPLFLISLRAGGTGLNLTAADNVIILDPWWNPAVEDQAADRAHRIGQTRPVSVYRLVTRGTIEDSILDLHASKRALVADVLGGAGAAGAISTSELIELIKAGAQAAETAETAETADEPEETTDQEPERDEPAVSALIEPRAGAVALYEADLKRDVERGLLSASSARTYVRVAHRFIDMVEESGDASLMEDLEHALEMVAEWAERGELTKSMVPVARVVLRRMLPLWNGAVGPSARASARDQKS
jgi:superfamily II DNA or RNA helicase